MWRANAVGVNGIGMAPRPRVRSSMPGSFNATTIAPLSLAMISVGVPAGAMKPNQPIDSYPGRPDTSKVGLINLTSSGHFRRVSNDLPEEMGTP